MSQHFKVNRILNAQQLRELESFVAERSRTHDEVHNWLAARGFKICRNAAGNWLGQHRRQTNAKLTQELMARFDRAWQKIKEQIGSRPVCEDDVRSLRAEFFGES